MHRASRIVGFLSCLPCVLYSIAPASDQPEPKIDQLAQEATDTALTNWSLAFPGEKPQTQKTRNLLLVSKASVDLSELGQRAEQAFGKAAKLLGQSKTSTKKPLTIYVVPRPYDFGEFVQMVEKRSLKGGSGVHWRSEGGLGYGVLGPGGGQDLVSDARLTRLVSSLLLDRWGAPIWYAEGFGQTVQGRVSRRDPQVRVWQTRAVPALSRAKSAADIFAGKLPAGDADATTWAFAEYLSQDQRRMKRLHSALAAGSSFDTAFAAVYGRSAEDVCDAWLVRFRRKRAK